MTELHKKSPETCDDSMKITVIKNGLCLVTGGVPLTVEEICNDDEGYCRYWRLAKTYPVKERYSLCRCGNSKNKPFCDGTHADIHFDGTESGDRKPFSEGAEVTRGPGLTLIDNEHLCSNARFCMYAGRIWNLIEDSEAPVIRDTIIEEAGKCPSGRLVLLDNVTRKLVEPELGKSIAIIEHPPRDEHGAIWVRGGIPVISADGKPYEIRNRVTLCRCGRSGNKPFCDGSHIRK